MSLIQRSRTYPLTIDDFSQYKQHLEDIMKNRIDALFENSDELDKYMETQEKIIKDKIRRGTSNIPGGVLFQVMMVLDRCCKDGGSHLNGVDSGDIIFIDKSNNLKMTHIEGSFTNPTDDYVKNVLAIWNNHHADENCVKLFNNVAYRMKLQLVSAVILGEIYDKNSDNKKGMEIREDMGNKIVVHAAAENEFFSTITHFFKSYVNECPVEVGVVGAAILSLRGNGQMMNQLLRGGGLIFLYHLFRPAADRMSDVAGEKWEKVKKQYTRYMCSLDETKKVAIDTIVAKYDTALRGLHILGDDANINRAKLYERAKKALVAFYDIYHNEAHARSKGIAGSLLTAAKKTIDTFKDAAKNLKVSTDILKATILRESMNKKPKTLHNNNKMSRQYQNVTNKIYKQSNRKSVLKAVENSDRRFEAIRAERRKRKKENGDDQGGSSKKQKTKLTNDGGGGGGDERSVSDSRSRSNDDRKSRSRNNDDRKSRSRSKNNDDRKSRSRNQDDRKSRSRSRNKDDRKSRSMNRGAAEKD